MADRNVCPTPDVSRKNALRPARRIEKECRDHGVPLTSAAIVSATRSANGGNVTVCSPSETARPISPMAASVEKESGGKPPHSKLLIGRVVAELLELLALTARLLLAVL